MPDVFITKIIYVESKPQDIAQPPQRYIDFHQDLQQLHGHSLDHNSYRKGGKLSYVDLAKDVMDEFCQQGVLNAIDMIVPAYWSDEYDSSYVNCGPYLSEQYQINCDMFDIFEQGTLATFTALSILQKYLTTTDYRRGLMLALEQTTHAIAVEKSSILPTRNGGYAIELTTEKPHHFAGLMLLHAATFSVEDYIAKWNAIVSTYITFPASICLCIRAGSTLSQCNLPAVPGLSISVDYYDSEPSLLGMLDELNRQNNQIIQQKLPSSTRYFLIVDEDVTTAAGDAGMLLLQVS